jgi:hypothetical protein
MHEGVQHEKHHQRPSPDRTDKFAVDPPHLRARNTRAKKAEVQGSIKNFRKIGTRKIAPVTELSAALALSAVLLEAIRLGVEPDMEDVFTHTRGGTHLTKWSPGQIGDRAIMTNLSSRLNLHVISRDYL